MELYCPNCGYEDFDVSRYCVQCGVLRSPDVPESSAACKRALVNYHPFFCWTIDMKFGAQSDGAAWPPSMKQSINVPISEWRLKN